MVSKYDVVCPYCKKKMGRSKALGVFGTVNINGYENLTLTCDACKKEVICDVEVSYTFRTRKNF